MTQLLLTEPQAAAALQLCEKTLRKARQQGVLPFIRIGRSIRYSPQDLQDFIERARECPSINAPARRSGSTASRSTVFDFEEARARKTAAKQRK